MKHDSNYSDVKFAPRENSGWIDPGANFREADPRTQVVACLRKLDAWIEGEGFRGWDPYDALNSPFLGWWGSRERISGIALIQLVRRCPVNLRPLLRIPKGYNPKAMGLFLATYAQKFQNTRNDVDFERACFFRDWLIENTSRGYAGKCWGYNFDWANRAFFAPANTPTIINTAFIGLAFLTAYFVLNNRPCPQEGSVPKELSLADSGSGRSRRIRGLSVARSACEFILHDLHVFRPDADELCFSYTPIDHRYVHNANLMGALLLAAVSFCNREPRLAEAARAAARFTVRRQRSDGSWPYGVAKRDGWVDNYHTGYVLVALKKIGAYLESHEFENAIRMGYRFWKTNMLFDGFLPKHSPDRLYPIDMHSIAQSILTFLEFSDIDSESFYLAWQLALWAGEHMQDRHGFFYYQKYSAHRIRIPYMRWSQAWMQRALASLLDMHQKYEKPIASAFQFELGSV